MKTFKILPLFSGAIFFLMGCASSDSPMGPAGSPESASEIALDPFPAAPPLPESTGQIYYVSTNGNDSNDGRRITTPWKTIRRVKDHAWTPGFNPGDSVLFQGGQTFTAGSNDYLYLQANKSKSSGARPFTLGTYGSGRATFKVSGGHGLYVWISGGKAANLGLIVKNLVFHSDGVPLDGGITYGVYIYNSSAGQADLVAVSNCVFTGFPGDGFVTARDPGKGKFGFVCLQYCTAMSNTGLSGAQEHSGSGILVSGADSGLIQYCSAYENGARCDWGSGPAGIWTADSRGLVIRSCESYNNRTAGNDGDGFDIDGGSVNCIIEYCYSHGNDGAGYLICQYDGAPAFSGNVVRYNVSEYDGNKGPFGAISFYSTGSSGGIKNTEIYGNTILNKKMGAIVFLTATGISGTKIRNNIFYTELGKPIFTGNAATNVAKFEGNGYWTTGGSMNLGGHASLSAWQSATGQEMLNGLRVGIQTDPRLTSPGQGGTIFDPTLLPNLNAYKLQTGSPCLDTGLDLITQFGLDPGNRDFYANAVPQRVSFDIGAHELP